MFICMQKINFITHFFLTILQRNSRLVISGDLGMPGHTRLKWQYQFKETFDVYLQAKNQLHPHPSRFPWDIAKYWKLVVLGGHAWLRTFKVILWSCWKRLRLSAGKKNLLHSHAFLERLQRFWVIWTCLFTSTQDDSINL